MTYEERSLLNEADIVYYNEWRGFALGHVYKTSDADKTYYTFIPFYYYRINHDGTISRTHIGWSVFNLESYSVIDENKSIMIMLEN
jgi:GH18 family chitinase